MSEESDPFGGWLADYKWDQLRIGCRPCGRLGVYRPKTLRQMLANPPMSEVPRLIAIKAGCELAIRFPGRDCQACFISKEAPKIETLAEAWHAGWRLVLTCERTRQALKSVKPCRSPSYLDMPSLVAALGHDRPIEALRRCLACPRCGSRHYSLSWIEPPAGPAAEPIPLKKAG